MRPVSPSPPSSPDPLAPQPPAEEQQQEEEEEHAEAVVSAVGSLGVVAYPAFAALIVLELSGTFPLVDLYCVTAVALVCSVLLINYCRGYPWEVEMLGDRDADGESGGGGDREEEEAKERESVCAGGGRWGDDVERGAHECDESASVISLDQSMRSDCTWTDLTLDASTNSRISAPGASGSGSGSGSGKWGWSLKWNPYTVLSSEGASRAWGDPCCGGRVINVERDPKFIAVTNSMRVAAIQKYIEELFGDLDYNLIVIFVGLFIVAGSFVKTNIPARVWRGVAGTEAFGSASSIVLISLYTIFSSQLVGNVAVVLMAAPEIDQLDERTQKLGWMLLAWVATVAGNFTLVGSAANIIVAEKAARFPSRDGPVLINAIEHFRVCGLLSFFCIFVGVGIIIAEEKIVSTLM